MIDFTFQVSNHSPGILTIMGDSGYSGMQELITINHQVPAYYDRTLKRESVSSVSNLSYTQADQYYWPMASY